MRPSFKILLKSVRNEGGKLVESPLKGKTELNIENDSAEFRHIKFKETSYKKGVINYSIIHIQLILLF